MLETLLEAPSQPIKREQILETILRLFISAFLEAVLKTLLKKYNLPW